MVLSYIWPYTVYKISEKYRRYKGTSTVVDTSFGPIQGLEVTSQFGYKYSGFQGVPYGKAPIGDLRFRDPEPPEPWTVLLKTTSDTIPVQEDVITKKTVGVEDCLHLNVYTKQLGKALTEGDKQNLCPVMVWIHGGAFVIGSNTKDIYNPEYLLQKDIVLVVVNYRLGAFGFLSVNDESAEVAGNAGIKDQVLALKWIRDNIDKFGGDPNNVTLFGESAGGCSVHLHLLSDMSKGLFHKAILMSGTALNPWSFCQMKNSTERLAKGIGWNGEGGTKEMMKILRTASVDNIIKVQNKLLTKEESKKYIKFPFGPVIEPYVSKQCIISKDPLQLCRKAWGDQIITIFTVCADEGLISYKEAMKSPDFLKKLNDELERLVPLEVEKHCTSEKCKELGDTLKKRYYADIQLSNASINTYTQLISDKMFFHAVHRTILSRLNIENSGPIYFLRCAFDSEWMALAKNLFADRGIKGVCHGDDMGLIFKNFMNASIPRNSRETLAIDKMVGYFTRFAATGNPNSDLENSSSLSWDPVEIGKPLKCLNFNDEVTFENFPENERIKFWDELYKQAGVELI